MELSKRFNGSKDELSQVFDLYKLKVLDVQRLEGGMINTSYKLTTKERVKFVLRVYKNGVKTSKDIQKELDFISEMRTAGIPVPAVINSALGKEFSPFRGYDGVEWQAIVMEFVEGRHLKPDDLNIIPECAVYQAKMHLVSAKLNKQLGKPNFEAMVKWMDEEFNKTKTKQLAKEESNKIGKIHKELKQDIESNYNEIMLLPYGDVHLDYDSDNIIVKGGKVKAILDFDDISSQPFILDTANSLLWWLFKNERKNHKAILSNYFKNYNKMRKILDEEYEFLSLFLRMRNLTLMCLLYVNISEEVKYEKVNQGIVLDPLLKQINKQ